jgi:hypothetical protein
LAEKFSQSCNISFCPCTRSQLFGSARSKAQTFPRVWEFVNIPSSSSSRPDVCPWTVSSLYLDAAVSCASLLLSGGRQFLRVWVNVKSGIEGAGWLGIAGTFDSVRGRLRGVSGCLNGTLEFLRSDAPSAEVRLRAACELMAITTRRKSYLIHASLTKYMLAHHLPRPLPPRAPRVEGPAMAFRRLARPVPADSTRSALEPDRRNSRLLTWFAYLGYMPM